MSALTLCAPETDEWDVASLDLDAYLDRIGHPRVPPSADALRSLHEAHVRAIPFENVDVVRGTHRGLGLDVIGDKLVRRHPWTPRCANSTLFSTLISSTRWSPAAGARRGDAV